MGWITDGDGLRRERQAICERMLDVSPIAWSDDLLGFGADSLAVLNLLLEIEHHTGHLLPLSVFLSAPSIEGLAKVLSSGAESVAAQPAPQSGPHLRPASKDDVEPICRFLEEAFPRVKAAAWCRLFDHHCRNDCLQLTVSDGSDPAFLVVKRRAHRFNARRLGGLGKVLPVRIPYSEILHCSAPELLWRHLERVKLAILRRQRTPVLVAEARLFPVRPRGVLVPLRTCYRSPQLAAGDLDRLYWEIVLLPI